jgi:hypothetical protein
MQHLLDLSSLLLGEKALNVTKHGLSMVATKVSAMPRQESRQDDTATLDRDVLLAVPLGGRLLSGRTYGS